MPGRQGRAVPLVLEALMCCEDHRIQCRERKGQREAGELGGFPHRTLSGGWSVLLHSSLTHSGDRCLSLPGD